MATAVYVSTFLSPLNLTAYIWTNIHILLLCLANTYGLGNGKETVINLFPHKLDDVLAFGTTGARFEALDCLAAT